MTPRVDRIETGPRMSQAVMHGGLVWLAGQCGEAGDDIAVQTKSALASVDRLLAKAGSDKRHLLSVTIWLADMDDYDAMNAVWDAWVPAGQTPARSCGEARLGGTGYGVEIICVAATRA